MTRVYYTSEYTLINTCFFHPSYPLSDSGLFYSHFTNIFCSFTQVIDKNDGKTEINTDPWDTSLKKKKCMHWNTLVNHNCLGMCVQAVIYSAIHVTACLNFSVFHEVTMKCQGQVLFVSEYFFLICPATSPVKKEMKFL